MWFRLFSGGKSEFFSSNRFHGRHHQRAHEIYGKNAEKDGPGKPRRQLVADRTIPQTAPKVAIAIPHQGHNATTYCALFHFRPALDESAKAPSVPSFLKPTPLLGTAQRSASHSDFLRPWPQSNQLMSKYASSVQSRAFNLIAT